jgi:hypothetical protein
MSVVNSLMVLFNSCWLAGRLRRAGERERAGSSTVSPVELSLDSKRERERER